MANAKKTKRSSPTLSNGVRTLGKSSDTIATVGVGIDSMIARGDSRRDYSHMLDCHMRTKNALVSILILCAVLPVLLIPMSAKARPIPDTGQTKCYNDSEEIKCPRPGEPFYGQDGNYTFNPPSYTKLDEARNDLADDATEWVMVRDNVTGLIWEVKTDDGSIHDKYDTYTWCDNNPDTNGGNAGTCGDGTDTEDFINALNTANFGGFSDWHLPNVRDLISLANLNRYAPAIDTNYFPNRAWAMLTYGYWSSTTSAAHNHTAWHMDFEIGFAGDNVKSNSNYVRAVRGGQPAGSHHFVDNGNGTVTDTDTGLMWQQATAPDGMNWQNALSYCEDLILGGYDDWRLPNVVELISLADPNGFYPAINTNYFPAPGIHYSNWSSTTWAYRIDEARDVGFNSGKAHSGGKFANMYVRAVRGRQSRSLEFGDLLVSGIPTTPTNQTGAFISVGGSNIVSYKYKLDEGSYGVETPVATVIVLSSLSHGSHTLDVIGKDANGIWQSEQDAPSIAWAVDTTPPNADAGSDSTVGENTTVTLSGLNSSDPDSGIAFYYWEQTAGTSISLSDTTVSQPTFVTPDVSSDGESLSFQLTVTNNAGSKSTATRIINISWSNVAPVSNAGSDQAVEEGDTVTLNGLGSSDEDDGISTYQWAQTAGTAVTISDKAAAQPIFTAPNVTPSGMSLTFQLTVTDTAGLQSTDTCIVNVAGDNNPPASNAGSDQTVEEGTTVTLDGSNSSDPDDGIHRYLWSQAVGTPITLSDATAVRPTFVTPPVDSDGAHLELLLLVIDNGGLQHTDTVSIDVEDNGIADFSDDVLPTTSKMGKVVGIKVEDGGAVTSFIMTLPSSVPDTSDAPTDMIYGLIDMELKPDTAGGTIRITIHLEDPAPAEYLWYKYGPDKGWYDYSSYAEFNTDRDQVTLTLVDGGMGDDDGVANGVIIDPSGLGSNPDVADTSTTTTTVEPTTSGSSGGGGGGCFISTVGN